MGSGSGQTTNRTDGPVRASTRTRTKLGSGSDRGSEPNLTITTRAPTISMLLSPHLVSLFPMLLYVHQSTIAQRIQRICNTPRALADLLIHVPFSSQRFTTPCSILILSPTPSALHGAPSTSACKVMTRKDWSHIPLGSWASSSEPILNDIVSEPATTEARVCVFERQEAARDNLAYQPEIDKMLCIYMHMMLWCRDSTVVPYLAASG
jgi:hypothetical protein